MNSVVALTDDSGSGFKLALTDSGVRWIMNCLVKSCLSRIWMSAMMIMILMLGLGGFEVEGVYK